MSVFVLCPRHRTSSGLMYICTEGKARNMSSDPTCAEAFNKIRSRFSYFCYAILCIEHWTGLAVFYSSVTLNNINMKNNWWCNRQMWHLANCSLYCLVVNNVIILCLESSVLFRKECWTFQMGQKVNTPQCANGHVFVSFLVFPRGYKGTECQLRGEKSASVCVCLLVFQISFQFVRIVL